MQYISHEALDDDYDDHESEILGLEMSSRLGDLKRWMMGKKSKKQRQAELDEKTRKHCENEKKRKIQEQHWGGQKDGQKEYEELKKRYKTKSSSEILRPDAINLFVKILRHLDPDYVKTNFETNGDSLEKLLGHDNPRIRKAMFNVLIRKVHTDTNKNPKLKEVSGILIVLLKYIRDPQNARLDARIGGGCVRYL